jgi:hypothetical protein
VIAEERYDQCLGEAFLKILDDEAFAKGCSNPDLILLDGVGRYPVAETFRPAEIPPEPAEATLSAVGSCGSSARRSRTDSMSIIGVGR